MRIHPHRSFFQAKPVPGLCYSTLIKSGSDPPRAGARLDACQREIRLNVSYLYSTTGYLAGNRDWRETTLDAACA